MKRCTLDKIASVTRRANLGKHAILTDDIPAVEGTLVAGRILNAKTQYATLEDVHGRMVLLHPGDVIAGALGHRDALHGFSGVVPEQVRVGDTLQVLNKGGVIGTGAVASPGVGEPFRLEVLGAVVEFPHGDRRRGVPAHLGRTALDPAPLADSEWDALPPILGLVGTSMNAGKTTAACALISSLRRRGLRVAAGKLTGVSLRADVYEMADCGAAPVSLFTDFGIVTTNAKTAPPTARKLLAELVRADPGTPEVIVLEFGDGLLGTYGVRAILDDERFRKAFSHLVLCASDPVGAWGGTRLLQEHYGLVPDLISGPLTDTRAGLDFCTESLGLRPWNALGGGEPAMAALFPEAAAPAARVAEVGA